MRDKFLESQALVLNDYPQVYYIHCFAHRLQLALIAASKEVISLINFFTKLTLIINIIGVLYKWNDELKIAQASDIAYKILIDELKMEKVSNWHLQ